jgi:hypothetical protein
MKYSISLLLFVTVVFCFVVSTECGFEPPSVELIPITTEAPTTEAPTTEVPTTEAPAAESTTASGSSRMLLPSVALIALAANVVALFGGAY